ncbi:type II toxin-antitoxin system ParD family antitoxin [Verminephrobacter eiseniae]|uniref:type II toxin-antitoxin system ParD family antitoxin n=1 Tax=Verminephrobacter eiseniae TaxID=364317 RepID=UPI0022383ABA|nr:type II toxin-antitoxin system ParD family antitoxin [Verminephrobacter eiseniae]
MPTRNVVLSEHQQDFVETLVQSGRYQNASEVLREGLRLVERREQLEAAKLKALQQPILAGPMSPLAATRMSPMPGSKTSWGNWGSRPPVGYWRRTDGAVSNVCCGAD